MMADAQSITETITPYLPVIGILAGGLLVGAFAIWNRRNGAVENRAPDVTEMWQQTERSRRLRRYFEDLFYETRGAFRGYVRRVQAGGSTELTKSEQRAHDVEPEEMKED